MSLRRLLLGLCWIAVAATPAAAAEFHVSPSGKPEGNGSAQQPWDLATALATPAAVQPGDTLWLHAGTYRGGFISKLAGKPGMPIVVRGASGGRATIDTHPRDERDNGLFSIQGADCVYRDLEFTCSHEKRSTEIPQSWPADIRRGSVDVRADRVALVNLVVHDQAQGFGFWSQGEGGEISGCLIYYNGWRGPDRPHGHGIYTQNERGTKRIADNLIFNNFGYGIQVYGSDKASLKGFDIDGNFCFDNGCMVDPNDRSPGILVGGGSPAARIVVRNNVIVGGSIRLGYPWGTTNEDVRCVDNYADQGLVIRDFRRGTIQGNTVVAHSNVVQLEAKEEVLLSGVKWDSNDYYVTDGRWGECSIQAGGKGRGLTFNQWRQETGFDASSTFTKSAPSELRVTVRPNPHEKGRAHVAIVNPAGLAEVEVDLSKVLAAGQAYRIVRAKDFYGKPIVEGTFDGRKVRLPMKPLAAPKPVGMPQTEVPTTEPQFGAFVVLGGDSR